MREKILIALLALGLLVEPCNAVQRLRGEALKSGDCIGVIAPSSCTAEENLPAPIELLKSHGYRVKMAPSCTSQYGYLAGTDEQRAKDLNEFFMDDEVKAILCMKGGYGAARILDQLDYENIAKNPKPLIGYSDITALHTVLGEKCGLVTIHAPMFLSLTDAQNSEYTHTQFFEGLQNNKPIGEISMPEGKKLETVISGKAEGIIMGGNLTLLASLVGTPYELDGTGTLLLIEEIKEKPYRIDRMLNQLWQNGLLSRVNGILLGDFVGCEYENENPDEGFSLEQILNHYARLSNKPVIKGIPAGHDKDNAFIPFGVHAVMVAQNDGTASLFIDGSTFRE